MPRHLPTLFGLGIALWVSTAAAEPSRADLAARAARGTMPSTSVASSATRYTFSSPVGKIAHFGSAAEANHFRTIHATQHNVVPGHVVPVSKSAPRQLSAVPKAGTKLAAGFAAPTSRNGYRDVGGFGDGARNHVRVLVSAKPVEHAGGNDVVQAHDIHVALDDKSHRFGGHNTATAKGVATVEHTDGRREEVPVEVHLQRGSNTEVKRPGGSETKVSKTYVGQASIDLKGRAGEPNSIGKVVSVRLGFHGTKHQQPDTNFEQGYTVDVR